MPTVEILEGWGWGIQEVKAPDPDTGEERVVNRTLIFADAPSGRQIHIPLDLSIADDMGGQLQGQPPKKHVAVAANGAIPPELLRGHLGPNGQPR